MLHPGILPPLVGPWALEPLRWVTFFGNKGYLSSLRDLPGAGLLWLGMALTIDVATHSILTAKGESTFAGQCLADDNGGWGTRWGLCLLLPAVC